jgi:hypothetical protein
MYKKVDHVGDLLLCSDHQWGISILRGDMSPRKTVRIMESYASEVIDQRWRSLEEGHDSISFAPLHSVMHSGRDVRHCGGGARR